MRSADDDNVERTAELGDPVDTFCLIQQAQANEEGSFGQFASGDWMGFLRAGTEVTNKSVLICDGDKFEVDGPPYEVPDPLRGRTSHIELKLRSIG